MEEKYDRFLDAGQEPRRMLQPIEGYQKMPFVSLEETVESIVPYCPDIRRRVFIAMSNCTSPLNGLTQDESASIYLYTMEWHPRDECLYYALNRTLRSENRNKLKPWFSYLKLILSALHKLPLEKNVIWRGVKLDLSGEYEVGKRYVWWAFSSCTLSIAILEYDEFLGKSGPRTLFNIECSNGRMIRSHSYTAVEDEILLLPATQFEVKSKLTLASDVHIIHLKQVDPPFPLIEPPSPSLSVESKIDLKEKHQTLAATSSSTISSVKVKLDLKEKHETLSISTVPSASVESKTDLKKKHQTLVAAAASSTISSVKVKPDLKEKHETLSISTTPSASYRPAFDLKKNKEQSLNFYRNEKLEQLIAGCSLKGLIKLEKQELTDSDIPFIVERDIIDLKCSDLNISWNEITGVGAEHLGKALQLNTSLKKLDISGNHVSNKGTRYITEALYINTVLSTLDLSRNQISDEGAKFIAQVLHVNSTLQEISLYTNSISDSGAQYIAKALTSNTTLTLLNLGRNEITDQGITHLAEMFKRNRALTHFYIGENRITNSGMKIIMNALCYNQGLKWLGIECKEIANSSIEYIQNMFKLNGTLTGLCLPKTSFSNQDQQRLQAMAKTTQNCQIWFL